MQVAAGGFHSLVLLEDGKVVSFGNGGCGQLGHGNEEHQLAPKEIEALRGRQVTQVSGGRHHSLVLLEDGEVLSFGDGEGGRLGHGDHEVQCTPKAIEALRGRRVAEVAASCTHSFLLLKGGEVLACGSGLSGAGIHMTPAPVEAMQDTRV